MIFKLYDELITPLDTVESFTIPGPESGYRYKLKHSPSNAASPMINFTGTPSSAGAFSLVGNVPAASGEVFLVEETAELLFHPSDSAIPAVAGYKIAGTINRAEHINNLAPWQTITHFFNGIPPYQSVENDGGWVWGFPLHSIYLPAGVADSITIKRLNIWAQNVEAVVADPGFETRIGVSLVSKGRPNDWDAEGFTGNEYVEGVNGFSVALNSVAFDGTTLDPTWYRNSVAVDFKIQLDTPKWLNLFTLDRRSGHSNIKFEIGAI